jgi:AcrR family transcriptional regulator
MTTTDTRQVIMDTAQAMVQAKGYNALSFRELAKAVGIKSASIHYYFPTKGDLGAALARRYTETAVDYFGQLIAARGDRRADHVPGLCRRVPRRLAQRQPHVPLRDHGGRVWRPAGGGAHGGRRLQRRQCRVAEPAVGAAPP